MSNFRLGENKGVLTNIGRNKEFRFKDLLGILQYVFKNQIHRNYEWMRQTIDEKSAKIYCMATKKTQLFPFSQKRITITEFKNGKTVIKGMADEEWEKLKKLYKLCARVV